MLRVKEEFERGAEKLVVVKKEVKVMEVVDVEEDVLGFEWEAVKGGGSSGWGVVVVGLKGEFVQAGEELEVEELVVVDGSGRL